MCFSDILIYVENDTLNMLNIPKSVIPQEFLIVHMAKLICFIERNKMQTFLFWKLACTKFAFCDLIIA